MLTLLAAAAAGLGCGVLSGFGSGGGSLLMVWMTAVLSMEQRAAQFSPFAALVGHTEAIKQAAHDAIVHGPDAPIDQSEFDYC